MGMQERITGLCIFMSDEQNRTLKRDIYLSKQSAASSTGKVSSTKQI
jgi:hypothetical protein